AENVQVSQDELTQYLIQGAAQYNMEPGEFIKVLDENGQIPAMVGEVARNKALAVVLGKATVVDTAGKTVDLTGFVPSEEDAAADAAAAATDEAAATEAAATDEAAADADESSTKK
ncbi:MAG: trigger factor, partial [Mycetocola sp.]